IRETSLDAVVAAIVGSDLAAAEAAVTPPTAISGPPLLSVGGIVVKGKLHDITFDVMPGEIVGVAGLVGSGRTVLLKTLFGAIPPATGSMRLRGEPYRPASPTNAIGRGVSLIPEDRRVHGAVLMH